MLSVSVGRLEGRGVRVIAGLMIGACALGIFALWERRLRPPPTGDEPGYLVVSESLWFDHDANLVNNFGAHARIDAASARPVEPAASVRIVSKSDWRSMQPLGLPILLTPAVAIGHRGAPELEWARRVMMLLAALLVWQIFELAADQVSLGVAIVITGGVALALPLVGYSNQLYPEIPAALLFTVGLRAALTAARTRPVLVGLVAAALPWLSVRYLALAVALVVACWLRGGRRLVAAALLAVSSLALALLTPASLSHGEGIPQSLINTYRIGVGGLFSPVFGLLPYAPQLALGVVGLGLVARLHGRAGCVVVVGALVYEFVEIPFGFRGYALPARFQIVLIPLLALGAARLIRVHPRVVVLFAAAAVLGVIVLAQAGSQPRYGALYNDPARPSLPPLRGVARVLPDFSLAPGHTGAVGLRGDREVALRRGSYEVTERAARGMITVPLTIDRSGTEYRAPAGVESVDVHSVGPLESRTAPSRRDVPLGLGWIAVTLASASLIAAADVTDRGRTLDPRGQAPMTSTVQRTPGARASRASAVTRRQSRPSANAM